MSVEQVVLLDPHGLAIGAMPKADVHGPDTPLHLGFSCWVFDDDGRLLLSRRASTKRSFGGLWTNTVCGHPAPGEEHADAVRRRARFELGLEVRDLVLALPDFRYRAEQDGLVENEICPVFLARADITTDLQPNPDEVDGICLVTWQQFRTGMSPLSPWCLEQAPLLEAGALLGEYAGA